MVGNTEHLGAGDRQHRGGDEVDGIQVMRPSDSEGIGESIRQRSLKGPSAAH